MVYIVPDWLNDKENEQKVRSLLEEAFVTDINPDYEKAIAELKKLGEHEIIKKMEEGYFAQ